VEKEKVFFSDDIPIPFGLTPYNDLQRRRDGIDKGRDVPLLQAVK